MEISWGRNGSSEDLDECIVPLLNTTTPGGLAYTPAALVLNYNTIYSVLKI